MKKFLISATTIVVTILTVNIVQARDQIRIVGSSTVYPFATVVAERFGISSKFKTPVVESTGSGGGLKIFCQGIGPTHVDITNASRRIKKKEIKKCASNSITDITEVKVGFKNIITQYVCKVLLFPGKRISLEYLSGPFEYLKIDWNFKKISNKELSKMFDLDYHTKKINIIIKRVFK